jgi:hypothetical protein
MQGGDGVAAGARRGAAAGEVLRDPGAGHALPAALDPVAALIRRFEAAAAAGGPTTLGGRARVRVRAVAGGFARERRP